MSEDFGIVDELADLDEFDEEILRAVRDVAQRRDPMPAGMVERIQFEMTLAALRAEIAELQAGTPAEIRTGAGALTDTVTFRGTAVSLMVRTRSDQGAGTDPATVDLECWVSEAHARIELWGPGGPRSGVADQHGRLEFLAVRRGPVRFVVHPVQGVPVATPAVEL